MASNDNYEWEESIYDQILDDESMASSRNVNFIVDINNGVYASNGTSLIQYNLSNIYTSDQYISNDMFFLIPYTMCYQIKANINGTRSNIDLTTNNYPWWAQLCLKNNHCNLVHSIEMISESFSLQQQIPFVNMVSHFQSLTKFSQDDLKKTGPSLGLYELDNHRSLTYNTFYEQFNNNEAFVGSINSDGSVLSYPSNNNQIYNKEMNTNCINESINKKLNRYAVNDVNYSKNNFYPIFAETSDLRKQYKPTVELSNNNTMCFYTDYVVIRLKDITNAMEKIPLCKRYSLKLNLYMNLGGFRVNVSGTNQQIGSTAAFTYKDLGYSFDYNTSTFTNTCPVMVNKMLNTPILKTTALTNNDIMEIYVSSFIGKASNQNIGGQLLDWQNYQPSTNLPSTRLYFYQYQMKPKYAEIYMTKHVNKRIVFKNYLVNQDNNIGGGSSYQKLITAGVKNASGLLIIPLLSKTISDFEQYKNPLDSCPNTNGPFSLINLQVVIGGVNVMNSVIDYNFDEFLSQIHGISSVMSNSYGISNGLISQEYFENALRYYYVDLERCKPSDQNILRSLEVKYIVNAPSNIALDIIYITFFNSVAVLNTQTGIFTSE